MKILQYKKERHVVFIGSHRNSINKNLFLPLGRTLSGTALEMPFDGDEMSLSFQDYLKIIWYIAPTRERTSACRQIMQCSKWNWGTADVPTTNILKWRAVSLQSVPRTFRSIVDIIVSANPTVSNRYVKIQPPTQLRIFLYRQDTDALMQQKIYFG